MPARSELELRSGGLEEELAALAAEGVQSILLEGGPKLAESFLRAGLVDRLLLFVAPRLGGTGPAFAPSLDAAVPLRRMASEPRGGDVLLSAYVHEP